MLDSAFAEKSAILIARVADKLSFLPQVGSFIWMAAFLVFLLPFISVKSKKPRDHAVKKQQGLFPSIEKPKMVQEYSEVPLVQAFPQPCSTGLTTRLLPFKNAKGEIEWVFTDEVQPGKELDAFKANPGTFKATPQLSKTVKIDKQAEILSPVTSISSNNESIAEAKNESSVSPQINTPSSTSSEDNKEDIDDGDGEITGDGAGDAQAHECPHCDRKFRMRGYLTRHLKKHMQEKAYQCPFRESSLYKDENDNLHQCHPSGGFSRRDTYKTHLKTRHFKFPPGTPLKGRSTSPGHCSMCGEWFENAEIWSEIHVEGAECKYLPAGFQGKSRIKNKLKKQMARLMKEEKRSKSKSKKATNAEYLSPGMPTPNTVNTPLMSNPSQYEYEDSPTQSTCSPLGQVRPLQLSFHEHLHRDMPPSSMFNNSPLSQQNIVTSPPLHTGDYDDEFCLDTEQMSISMIHPVYSPPQHLNNDVLHVPEYANPNYHPHDASYLGFIH